MDLRPYQQSGNEFDHLSVRDLLEARELYHVHLMRHPNVVATAVGRYRIRTGDGWPSEERPKKGTEPRTLENSEVRPYSWPCVLAFVERWVEEKDFAAGGKYDPDQIVPKTLYLPDGRRVPVCVVLAPREMKTPQEAPEIVYPTNNIGGGYPVISSVQNCEHVATIACLVTDGHRYYALTNRHVAGDPGETLTSRLAGEEKPIGTSSAKSCDRLLFSEVYDGWPGSKVYLNVDAGLIDIDNLDRWTAQIRDLGTMGELADLASDNLTLSLIGCRVVGRGCAGGLMRAEIAALFYRYKSVGGFEFVADFLIGPRTYMRAGPNQQPRKPDPFVTLPGDSATLWLLEPTGAPAETDQRRDSERPQKQPLLPLAVQWGAHVLDAPGGPRPQAYALATCLSTICRELGVDIVRDWNLDQPDTWGAVGHFSIASRSITRLSASFPRLVDLMSKNLKIITHDDKTIKSSAFKGMGSADFVPLADVPDFFWKHGQQGASRPFEGPNHFADMDQRSQKFKGDLLKLCRDDDFIDPDRWDEYYDSVTDILTGDPIEQKHRGLLPFRVWQIFEEMVRFAATGSAEEFVCAAGVLVHYLGDACQPLHISYLHDGDPTQPVTRTVHHRNGTSSDVDEPLGKGVHAAYEDEMVNANREAILKGLDQTPKPTANERVTSGFEAAKRTIELMRDTFEKIPPADIVEAYVNHKTKSGRAEAFWKLFGPATIECMQAGTHLMAVLWESAWALGDGENKVKQTRALKPDEAMAICAPADFLPSLSIARIGELLKQPA
jgi:hypothetical protein